MPSHRFGETLATQVTTANVVTYVTRFAAVGVLGNTNGITNRLHPGPLFGAREIARHFGEVVSPFVDAAVAIVGCFVLAVTQVLKVPFDLLAEERGDGIFQIRLIVFDGNDEVAFAIDDLFANVFLTAHGVNGDDGIGEVDLLEKLWNRRDFVGFFLGGDLSQSDAFLAGPGADDVQGAQSFTGIVRAAASLAIDGDETIRLGVVGRDGLGDPILETFLEGLRFESDEQSANAIA